MEPMEDLSIGLEEVQVCNSVNYYGEEITECIIEDLTDEEITKEYQWMTPVQRWKFNQLVWFHRDYEKTFGLTGMVHQLMYEQMSQQWPPMYEEIVKAEIATAIEDKHQVKIIEKGGIKHITPIKIKEEPSTNNAIIDLTDKEGLLD